MSYRVRPVVGSLPRIFNGKLPRVAVEPIVRVRVVDAVPSSGGVRLVLPSETLVSPGDPNHPYVSVTCEPNPFNDATLIVEEMGVVPVCGRCTAMICGERDTEKSASPLPPVTMRLREAVRYFPAPYPTTVMSYVPAGVSPFTNIDRAE